MSIPVMGIPIYMEKAGKYIIDAFHDPKRCELFLRVNDDKVRWSDLFEDGMPSSKDVLRYFIRKSGLSKEEPVVYPYIELPIMTDPNTIINGAEGLVCIFNRYLKDRGVKCGIFPEAKAWFFATEFLKNTEIDFIPPVKKDHMRPGHLRLKGKAAYRDALMFTCKEPPEVPIAIIEDTISSGKTIIDFKDYLDRGGCFVEGGISVFERGNGIKNLEERYPGNEFKGFIRMDIVPQMGKENAIKDAIGNGVSEDEMASEFAKHLYKKYGKGDDSFYSLNEHFRPYASISPSLDDY
jgi:adenine/guanine phosphoribosyltransferase-like PRPP-binding protein